MVKLTSERTVTRTPLVRGAKPRPCPLRNKSGVSSRTKADPHQRRAAHHRHHETKALQRRHLRKTLPHHDEATENPEHSDRETDPQYGDETDEGIATCDATDRTIRRMRKNDDESDEPKGVSHDDAQTPVPPASPKNHSHRATTGTTRRDPATTTANAIPLPTLSSLLTGSLLIFITHFFIFQRSALAPTPRSGKSAMSFLRYDLRFPNLFFSVRTNHLRSQVGYEAGNP